MPTIRESASEPMVVCRLLTMAVLKPFVVPLLEALPKGKYAIADDILRGYEKIASMDEAYIAPNSLVREFIGGSIYAS